MNPSRLWLVFFVLRDGIAKMLAPLNGGNLAVERINQGFGVEFCLIPKTGITITQEILCDILREYKGIPYKQRLGQKVTYENQCRKNQNFWWWWMATWLKPWETVRFTIVREPIERFVSVYKFVCKFRSDCPAKVKTIHDFARWLYKIQKAELKKGKAASRSTQFITWHSWPQTRYCNIENNRTTLVHHSSNRQKMRQEMMTVFRRARIPQRVANKALRHLLRSSTAHASENRTEKRNLKKEVMENNRTMEYIKAIYHQDFHFFEKHKF